MLRQQQLEQIKEALSGPLPGWPMQKRMAPEGRTSTDRQMLVQDDYRESSVLMLLYPNTDEVLHFVLIRRPEYDGVHSGQIAFPGGAREGNESLETTALRETYEEIGVPGDHITLLGTLSPMYIPPSNFMVYPYVGYYPTRPTYIPDRREVAEIIEPPLHLLTDKTIVQYEPRDLHRLGRTIVPCYAICGHKVWGATAMMLSEFAAILEQHLQIVSD